MTKTERKILDRIEKENLKRISFESLAYKREFNAANNLIKKGYLKELNRQGESWCSSVKTSMGDYKWLFTIILDCEVIKTK